MTTRFDHQNTPSFFILGNPRSGTTLLRLMLTCHSTLVVPPEAGFALWLHNDFRDWSQYDCTSSRLGRFLSKLQESRKFNTWRLDTKDLEGFIQHRKPTSYAELVGAVYRLYARTVHGGNSIVGDKNNYYIHHIGEILSLFPKAQFIHIVRDGRDVATSYKKVARGKFESEFRPQLPTDVAEVARHWSGAVLSPEGIHSDSLHVVRYEDLVSNPRSTVGQICQFLGVGYEAGMLEFYSENVRLNLEPAETMEWKKMTTRPLSTETLGRYVDELTPEEISVFEAIAGDTLRKFGYRIGADDD
jgi:hypothetical protein